VILKVRCEEMEDRVEPILAGAVKRSRFYSSNVFLALVTPTLYVLIAGLVVSAFTASADIGVNFSDSLLQTAVIIPAVWTITAVSVLVIGVRPQFTLAAWIGIFAAFVLTLLGPTFKLWDWILAISPFWHIP